MDTNEFDGIEKYLGTSTLARLLAQAGIPEGAGDYEPKEVEQVSLTPPTPEPVRGAFESLMADIEREIAGAEGGWHISSKGNLIVEQRISRDPSRRNNGGEYDYWKFYHPTGLGVEAWDDWSCDFASRDQYGGGQDYFECIIGTDGLRRMAELAQVTIAARALVNKEPGSFKKIKAAIKALE